MKALLLSLIFLFLSLTILAQKRPGYIASNFTYKADESKFNLPMQGYYILKDGTEVEAVIANAKPEFFIGDFAAASSLYICKSLTDKVVNIFDPSDPNHKEYIKKDQIKAFYLNGYMYGNVPNVGWRVIVTEGAIHSYIQVVKITVGNKDTYTQFRLTQWLDKESEGALFGTISDEDLINMLKKIPPSVRQGASPQSIVDGYLAKEYALYEAENKYNIWYDNNSEHAIDYILGPKGLRAKEKAKIAEKESQNQADLEAKENLRLQTEAGKNATQAPKQDHFKGRTTTVAAGFASAKPEVKVKKQKFKGRIDRIKADGNKVGVVVNCTNVTVNPGAHTFFSNHKKVLVRGSYKPLEGIQTIAEKTVEELNKGFGTDVFEVVDIKNIPYKIGSDGKKQDDWWATKYKVVLFYNYNPYYSSFIETSRDSLANKSYKAQMKVKSTAYLMAAMEDEKRMKSAGNPPKVASYSSPTYTANQDTKVWTIQELKALVNPKTDAEIVTIILDQQLKSVTKFIKKNNK